MSGREAFSHDPIAYFITWTTYGTWLPGDERGSWQRGKYQSPDELLREVSAAKLKETAFLLSHENRDLVEETVAKHCSVRSWTLQAVQARSNHVHVVVTAPGYKPETVREQFKAWCTRIMKSRYPSRQRFWTEGGSCRWLNREDDLEAAIIYVTEAQDQMGRESQD